MTLRRVTLAACLVLACREPFFIFPGGGLSGDTRAAAQPLVAADGFGTAQLETRPDDPYSVNVTYTVVAGAIYVNAGDTETTWARNASADPRVRLRVDGVLYDLRAERITDRADMAAFADAWLKQKSTRKDPRAFAEVWLFRLAPR